MVELRRLSPDDIMTIYRWICDSELRKMTGTRGNPDFETHKVWFEKKLKDNSNLIRIISYDDISVGLIGTNEIDQTNKNANMYLYIGNKEYRKKGIASIALTLFCEQLSQQFHCHKIIASVRSYNHPSIQLFKKNGFICEGIQKDQVFFDGEYYDRVLFGKILNNTDEQR